MVRRLLAAGYRIRAYDRARASVDALAGHLAASDLAASDLDGGVAADAATTARGADAVVLMLPDSDVGSRLGIARKSWRNHSSSERLDFCPSLI
ncbi:NAD(P)-binding domain-containing protein, partial [Nonomuraea fuscirosea]